MFSIPIQYQPIGAGMSFIHTAALMKAILGKGASVGSLNTFDPIGHPLSLAIQRTLIDN
ncbi:hypothetical protein D3C84_1229850 [compost metagenome]